MKDAPTYAELVELCRRNMVEEENRPSLATTIVFRRFKWADHGVRKITEAMVLSDLAREMWSGE